MDIVQPLQMEDTSAPEQVVDRDVTEDVDSLRITAVQVINRFHEVYSTASKRRLVDMRELFDQNMIITAFSPKYAPKVFLQGGDAILGAYLKTQPTPVAVSKRVYIELPGSWRQQLHGNTNVSSEERSQTEVTFVCDFHRRGTMPALGDGHEGHILLYQVRAARIVHIWGMSDAGHLAEPEEASFEDIQRSDAWQHVRSAVLNSASSYASFVRGGEGDATRLESLCCHFHNYDRMEVWGLM
jgi:hypothetical protein